jgi:peptidyl-prolyl cis-trans isomerase SurA
MVAASLPARAEIIERVVAVVNDEAILLSDLRRRASPVLEAVLEGSKSEVERMGRVSSLYKQLLAQLVDEELVEQAAREMSVSVSSLEVDQAIDRVRNENKLTEAQFWEAVGGQGFTKLHYRQDVRKQLLRLKVINQRVRARVNITEDTIRETYDDRLRQARRAQRFHAAHIFTPVPVDASATEVASLMRKTQELRARVSAESFERAMSEHGGGDLGWLDQGDLPNELEEALLGLSTGEISAPVRGPSGVHIFWLRERQAGDQKVPTYDEARPTLQRELLDKAMQRQEELFITGLRRDAIIELRQ